MRRLLDELLSYPGVPRHWRAADLGAATAPFLAIEFRKNGLTLRFFTTLTCFGTPHDVTLQELRIESFCSTSCRWRFYNDRRLYRARTQRECAVRGVRRSVRARAVGCEVLFRTVPNAQLAGNQRVQSYMMPSTHVRAVCRRRPRSRSHV